MPDSATSLRNSINEVQALLATQPALAAEKALRVLREWPDEPHARLLLGVARRNTGALADAVSELASLARSHPDWAPAHYELGATLSIARKPKEALESLLRAVRLRADLGVAWLAMVPLLRELGDPAGAERAYANHLAVSTGNPGLFAAATALCQGRLDEARAALETHLQQHPADAGALRMLSEVQARSGRYAEAESLLERCLAMNGNDLAAAHFHAIALSRQGKLAGTLAQLEKLLAADPRNASYLVMKANALAGTGEFRQATRVFAEVLAHYPRSVRIWLAYGDALKTEGRFEEAVEAYRRGIELAPSLGEAYWSLANLKTFRFSPEDVVAMRKQLDRTDLPAEDRMHFSFALGKELEDAAEYPESFERYAEGNRLRRAALSYDANDLAAMVRRSLALFTEDFLAQRRGWGCQDEAPVFVIGLPRSGTTLVEQILASHPSIEGTMELFEIIRIARDLSARRPAGQVSPYPDLLAALPAEEIRAIGQGYLDATRIQRKTGRPMFIDKNPNNLWHAGLIMLILPKARIIDVRRHPMACCFSCFKQHFGEGQAFAYSLEDLGRYYRDYVALMDHLDTVSPGRIHRVRYERLVEDTEGEVRRLLEYCGLPFEEACLRFYDTERAINTPSAGQVRRPIFSDAVDQWRHYAPWLGPLESALGPALQSY